LKLLQLTVLRLLRKFGTMSRSALAQRTGLNRSTISDLVTELEDLGLITESDTSDRTGVGRPSRMVALAEDVVVFAVNPEAGYVFDPHIVAVVIGSEIALSAKVDKLRVA
jgi:predicted transcriptional regulator